MQKNNITKLSNTNRLMVRIIMMSLALLTLPVVMVMAQDEEEEEESSWTSRGPSAPGGNQDPGVPVDGGISLLVAAGVGYGIKKVRDERKKKAQEVLSDKG